MPSPRSAPPTLSANDIRQITDELAEGRPPTVWFTEAAVGVPEGRSGKVVSVGDPAEGDFLQIRPAGSKDVMSFSPTEVTLTKPARKDKRTSASESAPRKGTAVSTSSTSTPAVSAPVAPAVAEPAAAAPQSPAKTSAAASGAAPSGAQVPAKSATPRAAKSAAARKPKGPEVSITVSGSGEGEWTVDVVQGKKRAVKGLTVPGPVVAQAAKLLHPEVAEVVDSVLDAVRDAQRAKVEQLQAELEQARRVLDELSE